MKATFMILLALVSGAYLLNLTFGVDILPDNLPFIGNLDEATATALLLGSLRYFGLDLTTLFKRRRSEES